MSEFPTREPYYHLTALVDTQSAKALSRRATAGFWSRLSSANLGRHPGFRVDVQEHIDVLTTSNQPISTWRGSRCTVRRS